MDPGNEPKHRPLGPWGEPHMDIEDMVMVSVDDHVVEPPDLFEGHLPDRYMDLAPKFVTRADGTNAWLYEGQELANVALNLSLIHI